MNELEQELVKIMDKYDKGEAEKIDVAIALTLLAGLANSENSKRAIKILMDETNHDR